MTLLNSKSYGALSNVTSVVRERYTGKFFPMFITGEMRPNQEIGKLQCQQEVGGDDYLFHNCSEVNFIPLFIKKVWEKYTKATNPKGGEWDQLIAFGGWNDEPKMDEDCRYVYYIAGIGLDPETKKVKLHEKDVANAKIAKDDKVLIYFRCHATKYDAAMKLMDQFTEKSKNSPPLSDDPVFEKNIVTPRRFIVKTTIGTYKTDDYGNKAVFKFDISSMLPDKMVENIMNFSMDFVTDFEKQFKENKENQIRKPAQNSTQQTQNNEPSKDTPTFEEPNPPVDDNVATDDFDLGI